MFLTQLNQLYTFVIILYYANIIIQNIDRFTGIIIITCINILNV